MQWQYKGEGEVYGCINSSASTTEQLEKGTQSSAPSCDNVIRLYIFFLNLNKKCKNNSSQEKKRKKPKGNNSRAPLPSRYQVIKCTHPKKEKGEKKEEE